MKNTRIITCLSLILAMLALFAAPAAAETVEPAVSAEEFTLEMLAEANSHEKLMEKCSSYYLHIDYNGQHTVNTYADSELAYTYNSDDDVVVYAGGRLCELKDGAFSVRLYVGMEPDLEWTTGLFTYTPEEELVGVEADGEKLIATTRMSAADGSGEDGRSEYVYEIDMQDLRLLGCSYTEYAADGTVAYRLVLNVEYDAARPARAQELFERMNPREDYRTVSVVAEPGMPEETVYSVNTARGDSARLYYSLDYKAFYTDPECTQVYQSGSSDPTQDLTLYVTREEK